METNFSKNPRKVLGYLMALAMVFFSTSFLVAQTTDVDITVGGGSFDSEITWDLIDVNGVSVSSGAAGSVVATVAIDGCYDINMFDSYGDGWNGAIYTITDVASGFVYGSGTLAYGLSSGTETVCMTAPAACADNEVDFNMNDSWGDGWNGGTYTLSDDAGNVVASGGLLSGGTATDALCLPTGCYDLVVGGGSYDSEITWSMGSDAGAAGTFNYISVGGALCGPSGCTDSTAINYDPAAISDDGSCVYPVPGCTDPNASNYDATANVDDGSCCFDYTINVGGGSFLSEVGWTILDGSGNVVTTGGAPFSGSVCLTDDCYTVDMTDSWGDGWNGNTLDISLNGVSVGSGGLASGSAGSFNFGIGAPTGACIVNGCTDPAAANYDPAANVDDGSCSYDVLGCTDAAAGNFDASATLDDGSCCYDNYVTITCDGGSWQGEVSWTLSNSAGTVVLSGGAPFTGSACLTDDCYTLDMADSFGDGWNGNTFTMSIGGATLGTATLTTGLAGTADFALGAACPLYGCLDSAACNYSSVADTDDGSCEYLTCAGCTDASAVNYDASATIDDGSCAYACTAAPYCEDFELTTGTWTNNGWTLDANGTPSSSTGPSTGANGTLNYMFFETSFPVVAGDQVSLTSECLDISTLTTPSLQFYNHMFGASTGTLDVLVNGDTVWSQSGDQGDVWNWAQVDLSAYAGNSNVVIEFIGTAAAIPGGTTVFWGDMAIDEICVDEYQVIAGCTDPTALNYDATANSDDGSCVFCSGTYVTLNMIDSWGDGWNGATFTATGATGSVFGPFTLASGLSGTETLCLPDDCYEISVGGGTFDSEITWDITDISGTVLLSGAAPYYNQGALATGSVVCPVYGCTDTLALNYDTLADTDDGSCAYICDIYVASAVIDAVPSCNGASDASATAIISGSFGDDYYLWSDGQTTSTATGLSAGTYTCVITDSVNGCSSTATVVIDETPVISVSAATLDATPGSNNGGVSLTVSGGTPCYNGGSNTLATGVTTTTQWAGNAFDVVATSDLQITSIDQPTNAGIGTLEVYYKEGSAQGYETDASAWTLAGSASITANLGGDLTNVPVSISVNAGETVSIFVHGTLTNGIACALFGAGVDSTYNAVVASDANLSVISGFGTGGAPGAGTTVPSPGSYDFAGNVNYNLSSYTYAWSSGDSTQDVSGLGLGPISVVVTDCNGCTGTWNGFVLTNYVYGCTDTLASNYDPAANTNWDQDTTGQTPQCLYDGCTDSAATNYDATANNDDGSCTYSCAYYGYDNEFTITLTPDWFSSEVTWYLLDANLDTVLSSGSYADGGAVDIQNICVNNGCYFIHGYDSFGDGWTTGSLDVNDLAGNLLAQLTLNATTFDSQLFSLGGASCLAGCMDSTAANFDATATIDDGSCLDTIYGCTDPLAANTTPFANVDDGSCVYCTGTYANIAVGGGAWQGEVSWTITNSAGVVVLQGGAPYASDICLPDDCYTVDMADSFGDGWNGNIMDVTDWATGTVIASDGLALGAVGSFQFSTGGFVCTVLGCTDPTAVNYDASANTDDGSCLYACTAAPYSETFDSGNGTWAVNGWINNSGATGSTGTGPSDDITGGGSYMYYETSGLSPVTATPITMTSECLDISSLANPCLRFNYHMWGPTMGTLEVVVNGDTVWALSGDQGNQWTEAQIDLANYVGSNVTISFVGNYGTSFTGDMAIDQVSVDECITLPVFGCIDSLATNYDPAADTDDGSCIYPCYDTQVQITMYDSWGDGWNGNTWTVTDDQGNVLGSGTLATGVLGTDSICLADGCYTITVGGGSFPGEVSFDFADLVGATVGTYDVYIGQGVCPVLGCTDSTAVNYNPAANTDDGSCAYDVLGCTDSLACNYNSAATLDDGSCNYGNSYSYTVGGGAFQSEVSWDLTDATGTIVISGGAPDTGDVCLDDACYTLNMYDSWGDGWNGNTFVLNGVSYTLPTGSFGSETICLGPGCTDPLALNYNPSATSDDGSCNYCQDNQVGVTFYDSWGDGWNGAWMYVYDSQGDSVTSGTLGGGSFYTDTLCLVDGCYQVVVGGGTFDGEITFNFGSLLNSPVGTYYVAVGNAVCPVFGCTDSLAVGYDPLADTDDGSCDYYGCTNPTATNYDPVATLDDGSCVFGCPDNNVTVTAGGGLYDSEITWDIVDGSGTQVASGVAGASSTYCLPNDCYTVNMYDSWGDGWNGATITLDDGSGIVYATDGLLSGSSGSFSVGIGTACPVYGCTDPTALNYDAAADTDDGSCTYCTVDVLTLNLYDSWGDGWNGNTITVGGADYTISFGTAESFVLCLDLSVCNDATYNALGTYQSENSWDIVDASGAVLASGGPNSGTLGNCFVQVDGCTDSTALNYDPLANTDDGSCVYCVDGCTDPAAFNYDPAATCDDGSCIAILYGCTDPAAANYFPGANTDDGSCIYPGCTDPAAVNYDPTATVDDGSCTYPTVLTITTEVCASATEVRLTGPWWGWDPAGGPVAVDNGNGTWTFTFSPAPTADMEYLLVVDGVQENLINAPHPDIDGDGYGDLWGCAPITDYWSYANRQWLVGSGNVSNTYGTCGSCSDVYGCMDATATNYDPNANVMDYSVCTYTIAGCTDPAADNYDATATVDDGSCANASLISDCGDFVAGPNATWTHVLVATTVADGAASQAAQSFTMNVTSLPAGGANYRVVKTVANGNFFNGPAQALTLGVNTVTVAAVSFDRAVKFQFSSGDVEFDALTLNGVASSCNAVAVSGCTDPAADNYDATATVDDGSCTYTIAGCTDPAADNYDATATVDDGSCTYPAVCDKPTPTGQHVTEIIHNRVRVHWDNMTMGACLPKQYRIQYREVGTTAWSQRNAQDAGLCNFGLATTSKRLVNLTPDTDYEYRIKAWYCNTTGASIWSTPDTFRTAPLCPNVGNFSVSTPLTTRAQFDWDDSNGAYSFVRIKLRVDSISNPTGADWQTAGGFGVNYGTFTRNKNGLVPGESYRGQARTWCDPAGGMYKAPSWTSLVFWTQPTSVRVEGGTAINNLDVYPNPSRDIFNVSFTSEDVQDLEVRVINVVGEVVYTESLQQFVGEYTKQVDLATYTKGIYFLEITTNNGVINKKLILQ